MLEVVEAIDGEESAFRCTEIRRRGPTAMPAREYRNPCGIHRAFVRADEAWRSRAGGDDDRRVWWSVWCGTHPGRLEKGARWISEAVR